MGMKKIKLIHVVYSLRIGGLESVIVDLVNKTSSNFDNTICCITGPGPMADRIKNENVKIITIGKREGLDLALPLRFAKLFSLHKPDIVHTTNWGTIDAIIGAKLARVPSVVHAQHGWDISDVVKPRGRKKRIMKLLSYKVDKFIAVSDEIREWLVEDIGVKKDKVVLIDNGVDTGKFSPKDKDVIRRKLGYDTETVIIGTVGRLDPVKNQRSLILAFKNLTEKYKNIGLMLIGDGPLRGELMRLTESLGISDRVLFLGEREDVDELLNVMDIFVLPSIAEGMPKTVLEAMSTGLPVVASEVGAIPKLVIHGETGLLIPPSDENALIEAIEYYLLNPSKREVHGCAGRKRILERFSLNRMVQAYEELFWSLK